MIITLILLSASVWPVAQSIRQAEIAFASRFKDTGKILFRPIQTLVNEGVRSVQLEKEQALTTQAQQLSHDIRPPLSALNIAVTSLTNVPDETRSILRASTERINDIANDLLKSRKSALNTHYNLKTVVEELIAEKRLQLQNQNQVQLLANYQGDAELAFPLDKVQFSRVLSNVINNAIEALPSSGQVTVHIRAQMKHTEVSVIDNGKGIPPEIISRLGTQSLSFEKPSGSGLGILHAKRTVEEAGGSFLIQSKVSVGTLVRLTFPNSI